MVAREDWIDRGPTDPVIPGVNTVRAVDMNDLGAEINGLASAIQVNPRPALEVWHDFTKDGNGAVPTLLDSGHSRVLTWNRAGSTPTILGGRFTNPDTASGVGASYFTSQLSSSVSWLGCDFDFSATGSTDQGLVALAAWVSALPAGTIGNIPQSPLHMICKPERIEFGVWSASGLIIVGTYYFAVPLVTGVAYHWEVLLDKASSRATVFCPDGAKRVFTHALIGSLTAPYVTGEIYIAACNTDYHPRIQNFQGSSMPLS